jgi:hypothetical protein
MKKYYIAFALTLSVQATSLWFCHPSAAVISSKSPQLTFSVKTYFKTVDVDGVKIFYREAGSPTKPTVVLLHGFRERSSKTRVVSRSYLS